MTETPRRLGKCRHCGMVVEIKILRVEGAERFIDFYVCGCDRIRCSKCNTPELSGQAFTACTHCGHPISLGT